MKRIRQTKGFTMAELLIVVAIIAVLTAIAIPVFSNQLEKSRQATDLANLRSAYAQVMASALTEVAEGGVTKADDGSTYTKQVKAKKKQAWLAGTTVEVGGITDVPGTPTTDNNGYWTVTYTVSTGAVTFPATVPAG